MMDKKRKISFVTIIFIVISIILAFALAAVLIMYKDQSNETVTAMTKAKQLEDTISNDMITIDELKQNAQKYNISIEFLQRFFDDVVVYKGQNGITYTPIDESLNQNDYDFDNIVSTDKEKQYVESGTVKSIKGIDVSTYQGNIDWEKVKADGVEYAIIRVGYRGYGTGKIVLDDKFEKNIENATKAGIKVGVYFFSQAISVEEAREEALYVIDKVSGYKLDYPIVFDMEEIAEDEYRTKDLTKQQRTEITKAFCDTVIQSGHKAMVYGNIKWFMEQVDLSELEEYDKWFAQYFNTPFFPYELAMWQYTGKGQVDGIEHAVDLNICFKEY